MTTTIGMSQAKLSQTEDKQTLQRPGEQSHVKPSKIKQVQAAQARFLLHLLAYIMFLLVVPLITPYAPSFL